MLKVELIYDSDCPHVDSARAHLLQAFAAVKMTPEWLEWDRQDTKSPQHVLKYGSPTVLVNGKDIEEVAQGQGASCCRVYESEDKKLIGVPPVEKIAAALALSLDKPRAAHEPEVRAGFPEE